MKNTYGVLYPTNDFTGPVKSPALIAFDTLGFIRRDCYTHFPYISSKLFRDDFRIDNFDGEIYGFYHYESMYRQTDYPTENIYECVPLAIQTVRKHGSILEFVHIEKRKDLKLKHVFGHVLNTFEAENYDFDEIRLHPKEPWLAEYYQTYGFQWDERRSVMFKKVVPQEREEYEDFDDCDYADWRW
jgi:hypothetical protein